MTPEKEQKLREAAKQHLKEFNECLLKAQLPNAMVSEENIALIASHMVSFAKSPEVSEYHAQKPVESDAVEFAEWLRKNGEYFDNSWHSFNPEGNPRYQATTLQAMYTEYLNQKTKSK